MLTITLYINGTVGCSNKATGMVGATTVVVYKLAITNTGKHTLKIVLSSVLHILQ